MGELNFLSVLINCEQFTGGLMIKSVSRTEADLVLSARLSACVLISLNLQVTTAPDNETVQSSPDHWESAIKSIKQNRPNIPVTIL